VKVGVLALQGNFEMHCKILESIDIEPILVKYNNDLELVEGLIIPGGESTTMSKLMKRIGLDEEIKSFARQFPVFGTCAGMILMSSEVVDSDVEPLNIINISTIRNGYGRQIKSETVDIKFDLGNSSINIPASFIRAPKVVDINNIEVIAKYEDSPVIVKNDKHMAISFHPELDNISIFHDYVFKGLIKN
jgi:5'-phosphate synthase pdxT subunit